MHGHTYYCTYTVHIWHIRCIRHIGAEPIRRSYGSYSSCDAYRSYDSYSSYDPYSSYGLAYAAYKLIRHIGAYVSHDAY